MSVNGPKLKKIATTIGKYYVIMNGTAFVIGMIAGPFFLL